MSWDNGVLTKKVAYAPEGAHNCELKPFQVVHSYKIYKTSVLAGHESVFCWTNPVNQALKWRSLQSSTMEEQAAVSS